MNDLGAHSKQSDNKKKMLSRFPKLAGFAGEENDSIVRECIVISVCVITALIFSIVKMNRWLAAVVFAVIFVISGFKPLRKALRNIRKRDFSDSAVITCASALIAFLCGSYLSAVFAVLIYRVVIMFYSRIYERYEDTLGALSNSIPNKVKIEEGEDVREVSPRSVEVDDVIVVDEGETIPLDGIVISGMTSVGMNKLGGNSTEIAIPKGAYVCAGCVNLGRQIRILVKAGYNDTYAAKLTDEISHAYLSKSGHERIAAAISRYYPAVVLIAAVVSCVTRGASGGAWTEAVSSGASVLALATSGCVGVSVPFAYNACVANLSKHGIVVKKNRYLLDFAETKTVVFSKNGIVTDAKYTVYDVIPVVKNDDPQKLLSIAATVYSKSNSVIGAALRASGKILDLSDGNFSVVSEIQGKGIIAKINGTEVIVGTPQYLKDIGVEMKVYDKPGMILLCIAVNKKFRGQITISDKVREGTFEMVDALHLNGVENVVMLTVDEANVAKQVAASLNFDLVKYEQDDEGKMTSLKYLMENKTGKSALAYVGNYRNDRLLMEAADIGVSLKTFGSEYALENADICILGDDIRKVGFLSYATRLCHTCANINIFASFWVKIVLLAIVILSSMPVGLAVLLDSALYCMTLVNSERVLNLEEKK